ncbi:MAG: DUF2357 domain-containing protein [Comamonadaceae bacterium]|nr:DUF2357 domain-containing protein [Comamonadaceae bacterium]
MSDQAIAFRYRRRYGDAIEAAATVGATLVLDERHEYVLALDRPLDTRQTAALSEIGGEVIGQNLALLSFGNFVGTATFLGVRLDVISTKLGDGGASRLLDEVSQLASTLVFGWRSPTTLEGSTDKARHSPVPYHQLQALREAMLQRRPGSRLQDWLDHIERNPIRRFDSHRPVVAAHRVRRLDHQALTSMFAKLDRLATVPSGNTLLATNPLADALTFGHPPKRHFPSAIAAPQVRLSYDTMENRFVRHVLRECIAIVGRFSAHPKLHQSLRRDSMSMAAALEDAIAAPHLMEAGTLTTLHAPSQALTKAEGYRDLFAFWSDLTRHASLPPTAAETTRMLEGRDIATLYEYWVFLKVLAEAKRLLGLAHVRTPRLIRTELDERLGYGCVVQISDDVTVEFNGTYSRSLQSAYSTPLRPDVVLRVKDRLYAFDAKYRLDRLSLDDDDPDDTVSLTYKRADLYKMHAYRDAIREMRAAFVVFPGTDFVFFERSGIAHRAAASVAAAGSMDGVGAVPLRPAHGDPGSCLREVLRRILISAQTTP